jgi:hypothetical protein
MKEFITGKSVSSNMKDIAKSYLQTYSAGCVCVAVENLDLGINGRTKNGGERSCFIGVSGPSGQKLLRDVFNEDRVDNHNHWQREDIITSLQTMAANLVTYNSKAKGTAIVKQETWSTHNCAESAVALYLYKQGKQLKKYTIASYELKSGSVGFKPLCQNCSQWVKNHFNMLPGYG